MRETVEIPEDISAELEEDTITLEKDGETVEKEFDHPLVKVEKTGEGFEFSTESSKKEPQSVVSTFRSLLNNMVEGLEKGYRYKLKGVYAHFPMTIQQSDNKIEIENFMGERKPREIDVMEGVNVRVDGDDIILTGPSKENVSQTAARIEQACKKGNKDPRTFQDGIYITESGTDE